MDTPETNTVQMTASTPTRPNGAVFIESESLATLLGQQEGGKTPGGQAFAVDGALRIFHALGIPALLLLSRGLDNISAAFGCYEHSTLSTQSTALHGLEIVSFGTPGSKAADNEGCDPADHDLVPDALRELVRHICTGRHITAAHSWFITDCADYLPCAAVTGCATVLLRSRRAGKQRRTRGITLRAPDFVASDLSQAALRIAFERHETITALRTLYTTQTSLPTSQPPVIEHSNIAA